ncbi:hypothetical protein GIB67_042617 [Kingdonia uniflora]|uniref:Uncharacterized protein n=1 Tax=Kingdonia uniflora TaxID=39325 RepID=A0A7J7M1K3_9MAGN|nr:hypothetical protein GIB67_042617 [Kingdonia uniflora]
MASTLNNISSTGSVVAPSSTIINKKLANTSLSSFGSISSISFMGRRQNAGSQRRCSSKVRVAKELYFNKNGLDTKKLQVELEDPVENISTKLVRQAVANTNDLAGDGTTTSVILAQGLIAKGVKVVTAGANLVQITRGIDKTTKALVAELKLMSKEVEDNELADVATVNASNNYEVGQMIPEAMSKVGRKGVVTLEEGKSSENNFYVVEGMQFDHGYIAPYFVTDSEKMTVKFENYKIAALKAPGFGECKSQFLNDSAILIGATVIRVEIGLCLDKAEKEVLGHAAKVVLTKEVTTIVGNGRTQDTVNKSFSYPKPY